MISHKCHTGIIDLHNSLIHRFLDQLCKLNENILNSNLNSESKHTMLAILAK